MTVIAWSATVAALAWLTFIVWYTVRAKWWKNSYGRNAVEVSVLIFIILARIAVVSHFPNVKQSESLGAIIYTAAALFAIHRIALMEQAQRETDRIDRDERSTE